MVKKNLVYAGIAVVGLAVLLAAWPPPRPSAQSAPQVAVQIDNDDIGGVVYSENRAEGGACVVGEKSGLGSWVAKVGGTEERGGNENTRTLPATGTPEG